jgi:cytochrome c biogenesis factor
MKIPWRKIQNLVIHIGFMLSVLYFATDKTNVVFIAAFLFSFLNMLWLEREVTELKNDTICPRLREHDEYN